MIELNKIKDFESKIENVDEVSILSIEAQKYLNSFKWCNRIIKGWLAKDWGYILCLFYFKIEPYSESGADEYVWIIVGDIPSAYIDIESAHNEKEALETYIFLMEEWINNIKKNKSMDDCFPVNVTPSKKYANMLSSRIKIIKSDLITDINNVSDLSIYR